MRPVDLVRVLQLASPALPIGAFSYSQGLEGAVELGWIRDARSAERWIGDGLRITVANADAPIAWRLLACAGNDDAAFGHWNAWYLASRETSELRAETTQMGHSLAKLARDLGVLDAPALALSERTAVMTLPAAFALIARGFGIEPLVALTAYVWSWLETQVLALQKVLAVGQVAAQRLLWSLGREVEAVVDAATRLGDDDLSTFAPGLVIASATHETQYSRLFRS